MPHISKPEIKGEWSLSSLDVSLPGQEPLVTTGYKAGKTPEPLPHAVAKKNKPASLEGCTVV